jgi:hypothetical protein
MDFWTSLPLLGAAAFAAGVLNAIAGGPAHHPLVCTGVP